MVLISKEYSHLFVKVYRKKTVELWKRICEAMLVKMDNIRLFTCADNVHCYAKAPKWLQLKEKKYSQIVKSV